MVWATASNNMGSQLAAITGAGLINTKRGEANAVTRSVAAILGDFVVVQDFGAVGDGVTDDAAAFAAAFVASKHVIAPYTGSGYVIGSSLSPTSFQVIDIYDDVTYTGAAATGLFKVAGSSQSLVTCHRKVIGNDNNWCVHFETGTVNTFRFNETVGFVINCAFIQAVGGQAGGHTLVENRIEYRLISGFNAAGAASITNGIGVLFRNTTGDAPIAMEGTELYGGFIWRFNGHGVLVEDNVNAKYIQMTGVIDNASGGGQDYTNNNTDPSNALLLLKFLREAESTFGINDMYLNARTHTFGNNGAQDSLAFDFKNTVGITQPITSMQTVGEMKGGATEATRYGVILAGSDPQLNTPHAINLAAYYDPGTTSPPAASDEKVAGLVVSARRNDGASGAELGMARFVKRAATNICDFEVLLKNETGAPVRKFKVTADGKCEIGAFIVQNGTVEIQTGAGSVNVTTAITHLVTTGANALTLVDGEDGQRKSIIMKTDAGNGTLTPTNLANGTTITFANVGDSAELLFTNGAWHFMGGTAVLA